MVKKLFNKKESDETITEYQYWTGTIYTRPIFRLVRDNKTKVIHYELELTHDTVVVLSKDQITFLREVFRDLFDVVESG